MDGLSMLWLTATCDFSFKIPFCSARLKSLNSVLPVQDAFVGKADAQVEITIEPVPHAWNSHRLVEASAVS